MAISGKSTGTVNRKNPTVVGQRLLESLGAEFVEQRRRTLDVVNTNVTVPDGCSAKDA